MSELSLDEINLLVRCAGGSCGFRDGSVEPLLIRVLTEKGLLRSTGADSSGTKFFDITEEGFKALENHRKSNHPTVETGAQREKANAVPYDLVPYQEITDAFVRVAEFGVKKYAPWNWSKGLSRVQLLCSLLRHSFAYLRGQDRDQETGLLHTDHILWNAVALSHNIHWNLADGRRAEPDRDYKSLAQDNHST